MSTLFRVVSAFPLFLTHAIGWLLGWAAFLSSGGYRRRFLSNARQAGYGFSQVRQAVGEAGKLVSELPRIWMGKPAHFSWENAACIDRAYAAGKGILFLTPHMGCFEITPQALAASYSAVHGPMTVLYRPARKKWMQDVVSSSRARPGLETAPTTLGGVRQMIKALRHGEAVGLLPDQVPPEGMGEWATFFEKPAFTMTLAARLAMQTGATVLVAWGERLSWGRGFVIHVRELQAPLQLENLSATVAGINREMERLIRECPQQYLWGYARYKNPRAMESADTAGAQG